MAHNITDRDGIFTVRQPAWHGLGTVLEDYPTVEEAKALVHPWEPVSEPLYRQVPIVGEDGTLSTVFEPVENFVLNARSDDGYPLGVVSDTYTPVTNQEMYDIAEVIEGVDKGQVQLETGGSLFGGKKVWLLLRLREPISVKGDPQGATIAYYALQNAHDGSSSFRGQGTNVRVVCDNTSRAADLDAAARGTEFTFHHTKNIGDKIEDAKQALAGWRESVQQWRLVNEELISMKISDAQAREFAELFIPMPPARATSDRVIDNVVTARDELLSILNGPTCEGIGRTAYGLVQSASEYHQHIRAARSLESRFRRAYLEPQRILTDAVEIAKGVALAA